MPAAKKNILLFGANSFIAKAFIQQYSEQYNILPVYRKGDHKLLIDFNNPVNISELAAAIAVKLDAVLFLQGINPSKGATEITEDHFLNMMKVNLSTPTLLLSELKNKMSKGCMVLMVSSVAKKKGSYDPSYAAAKSAMPGLMQSLANAYPEQRFNIISLGLVEGSPVFEGMTEDFRSKHASRMQDGKFISAENVNMVIDMLIRNNNINRAEIAVDGGFN